MRVIGVDPGLTATGYGVVDVGQGIPLVRAVGCPRSQSRQPLEVRICGIYDELLGVLEQWRPGLMVLEGLFSEYKFPRTAITMGHVRGVICLAATQAGARVLEVSPAEVKSALTGSGRATKEQVQRSLVRMLRLEAPRSRQRCWT